MIKIIDHTDPHWYSLYVGHGRENGAMTYSKDIVKYHLPIWRSELKKSGINNAIIGTCRLLRNNNLVLPKKTDLVVQYLHTYSSLNPLREIKLVTEQIPTEYKKIMFVTAYKDLVPIANAYGYNAIFIPMTVDAGYIRQFARDKNPHLINRVVYFGNLTRKRRRLYTQARSVLLRRGMAVDLISNNRLNGGLKTLSQQECWQIASQYTYGMGAGRSALELAALGVKVMYINYNNAYVASSEEEYEMLEAKNFSGNIGRDTLFRSVLRFNNSIIRTNDIKEQKKRIAEIIATAINR